MTGVQTCALPISMIKTGGVLRQWNEIDKAYKSDKPKRGSIFIMDYGKGLGHTGIVEGELVDDILE